MNEQVDLNKITDIKELKAMAYEQVIAVEMAQNNLRAVQTRIQQVTEGEVDKTDKK